MTGSDSELVMKPLPSDDPKQRQPDIRIAREQLDWSPTIELRDGVAKTVDYFRNLLRELS